MVRDLLERDDFMVKIDMKDAYFAVPIHEQDRGFLAFQYGGDLFWFTALPFGLSSAPYVYTRIMKAAAAALRRQGIRLLVYLDDWIFFGNTSESVLENANEAMELFSNLGLTVNYEKSQLVPTQIIEFLGLIIDSNNFLFIIPEQKAELIVKEARSLLDRESIPLRCVSRFVGRVIWISMASGISILFLRTLQSRLRRFKLTCSADYEAVHPLPPSCKSDLIWFTKRFHKFCSEPILEEEPSYVFTSDASDLGWGAIGPRGSTAGRWKPSERSWHINQKEMLACYFGLRCLGNDLTNCTVRLEMDNTTSMWYINKKGGTRSSRLNSLTREIWLWATRRKLRLLACFRPGTLNSEADWLSRNFTDASDFSLDPIVAMSLFAKWGVPEIDLFASRASRKCRRFYSFLPDPGACAVDAFAQDWSGIFGYAFPPFNMVGRVIRKAVREHARIILVCPRWQAQSWWPLVSRYGKETLVLETLPKLLVDPQGSPHPCLQNSHFQLIACLIWVSSGEATDSPIRSLAP
ncbi:hypothetical protein ANCDUO_00200 [Ancylostoma duodenale]|uniref:Reverse transcriptase domain-containing protein n=1 Tax=Ancylostoma duodenale TaxID=51022 RepID=A0A0C2E211_9BILA|nr:hypothetical protein ANCDUO_00200 [Ancylostoma duodenale]